MRVPVRLLRRGRRVRLLWRKLCGSRVCCMMKYCDELCFCLSEKLLLLSVVFGSGVIWIGIGLVGVSLFSRIVTHYWIYPWPATLSHQSQRQRIINALLSSTRRSTIRTPLHHQISCPQPELPDTNTHAPLHTSRPLNACAQCHATGPIPSSTLHATV